MCFLLDTPLPLQKSICSRADNFVAALSLDIDIAQATVKELKNLVCDRQRLCLWNTLNSKLLHGNFVTWCCSNPVDLYRSFRWLGEFLHSETESTIFAIQDQVIRTRVYEAKLIHVFVPTLMCRLCNSHEETVQHLTGVMFSAGTNKLSLSP